MSRNTEKLNVINHRTFEKLQKNDDTNPSNMLRSSKYKYKHKVPETLFDFICISRQKRKQGQIKKERQIQKLKRPNLSIAKTVAPKLKGKRRLIPKEKITTLKRRIRSYRKLKETEKMIAEQPIEASPDSATNVEQKLELPNLQTKPETQIDNPQSSVPVIIDLAALKDQLQTKPAPVSDNIQLSVLGKLDISTLDEQLQNLSLNEAKKCHPIHSRRFRSYCDNCKRPRLKKLTTQLLNDLNRFQKRAFLANEIKARAHPRMVVGFRESLSRLNINKVKLLFIATDCETCPGEHGLDETIDKLKSSCQQHNVPCCFSLQRRELAFAIRKQAQISCVAILDYDGAQDIYKELLLELDEARKDYKRLIAL